jgi:uncharacterized membrane protein
MLYTLPIASLILTIFLFFALARGRYSSFGVTQTLLRVFVALPLLFSGVALHFLRLHDTLAMMPPGFPDPGVLILLTGVFEIAGAIALFIPTLRRTSAFLIAVLMVAIFPANIYVAGQTIAGLHMPTVPVRTTMQAVYLLLVLLSGFGIPGKSKAGL